LAGKDVVWALNNMNNINSNKNDILTKIIF